MRHGPMHQTLLPYSPERDVYRLLGVPSTASNDEISSACRRLARTFHPDHNRSARANAEMQVVNAVRQVLTDPDMRAAYDRERYRFHAVVARPAAPPRPSLVLPEPTPSRFGRYVRAAVAGLRATMSALAPARCRGCRTVISGEDAYCVACGTPLLTGSSPD